MKYAGKTCPQWICSKYFHWWYDSKNRKTGFCLFGHSWTWRDQ